ncbi:hypothetical protein REPUB_Repub08aG0009900 [Reevesia pubescens]
MDYQTYQIEIYSSKTRTWRLSGHPFIAPADTNLKYGVYCNGVIHWLRNWFDTCLYFNVDERKLGKMPALPPTPEGWNNVRRLREANEEKAYMVFHIHGKAIHYNIKNENFKKICDASWVDNMNGIHILSAVTYGWNEASLFIPTLISTV